MGNTDQNTDKELKRKKKEKRKKNQNLLAMKIARGNYIMWYQQHISDLGERLVCQ